MSERLACCVPFCNRTRHNREGTGGEWICSVHWPLVSRLSRRRLSKMWRLRKRRFGNNPYWEYPAGSPERLECVKVDRLCRMAWQRCKTQAIERAVGIS